MSKATTSQRASWMAKLVIGAAIAASALVPTAGADAAIDQFVDCSDSFWAVTCGFADAEPAPEPQRTLQIDNDATCADAGDGMIICHT